MRLFEILYSLLYVLFYIVLILLVIALAIPVGLLIGLYWIIFKSGRHQSKEVKFRGPNVDRIIERVNAKKRKYMKSEKDFEDEAEVETVDAEVIEEDKEEQ